MESEKLWCLTALIFLASGFGGWLLLCPFKDALVFAKRSRLRQISLILSLIACVASGIILGIGHLVE
ncbi:MAG: hypothetical protein ACOX50_03135 [Patescibacteria group bacterium]|jgi:hypothetical protein